MKDMEKIQRLIALKDAFPLNDDMIKSFFSQIKDEKIIANYDRIARGLKVEDYYKSVYSAMPWVKIITGLKQEQESCEKEKYQIPDYLVTIENSQLDTFPVLIDVKSVKEKHSCEIMAKQVNNLQNYAAANKIPFLIAIFWEKYDYWTHVSIKNFEQKTHTFKISFENAFINDLSHIFGDLTYFLNKKIYRRTLFELNEKRDVARHEKYGEIKKIEFSTDNINYKEHTIIDSLIIDSMLDMKPIYTETKEKNTIEIEELKEIPHYIKLSNWILRTLKTIQQDCNYRINGELATVFSRKFIVEFMKCLGTNISYQIPKEKNNDTELFFKNAYKNTFVLNDYYK